MLLKTKLENLKSHLNNDNVLSKLEERYCYAKDALNLERDFKVPDLVIFVETIEDIQKVVKYANEHSIPIVSRGAGTNMVGSCVCTQGGIVLNFSKMNKILDINPVNLTAKVQPGAILGDFKKAVEKLNLFFPSDPSNYKVSTIGGAVSQSSGGAMTFKYGTIKNYILSMTVVTADGNILTLGNETSKNPLGYHLSDLIIGSEGTLALISDITLKLIPKPETKKTIISYFNDANSMVEAVTELTTKNIFPTAIDFMDNSSIKTVEDFLPSSLKIEYNYLLLIDIDGSINSVNEQLEQTKIILSEYDAKDIQIPINKVECERIWEARHSSYAAATRLAPDVVSDDIIVPRNKLSEMIKTCEEISKKYNLKICLVGHLGDGNLHPQIVLNLEDETEFRNYQSARSEMYEKVYSLGGNFSAEHGIGIEKKDFFEAKIDKQTLDYMKAIKKVFDPKNILNPDKIFNL